MHSKFKKKNFETKLRQKLIDTGINKKWLDEHLIVDGLDDITAKKLDKATTKILDKRKGKGSQKNET